MKYFNHLIKTILKSFHALPVIKFLTIKSLFTLINWIAFIFTTKKIPFL